MPGDGESLTSPSVVGPVGEGTMLGSEVADGFAAVVPDAAHPRSESKRPPPVRGRQSIARGGTIPTKRGSWRRLASVVR